MNESAFLILFLAVIACMGIVPFLLRRFHIPAVISLLLVGILIGLAMMSINGVLDAWWKLSSIFSGGMLGLFLLGIIPQKINRRAALAGTLCGVGVIGWISMAGLWHLPGPHLHEYLAIVLGTTTIFLVGFLITILKAH